MTKDLILAEREGAVLRLTMNRPEAMNVLDEPLAEALLTAFSGVAEDPSIAVVVLAGAGRSFMAGGDLSRFRADLDAAPETASFLIDRFHAVMRLIKAMPQPVIAAVQGPVAGGGVGLALACDLVIAAQDASFVSAYTRLGTNPDGGTSWSLTRLLGPQRALAFMLFNDKISAEEALSLGLVGELVPVGELHAAAMTLARRVAQGSRGATAATKRLVLHAAGATFDEQLEQEKIAFVKNAGQADFREGITAFFEKRPARF